MRFIVISLLLGFGVGYFLNMSDKIVKINGRLQTACLILLIFSMGLGIGVNKEVLQNLPVLGARAVVFALVTLFGSVFVVYLFTFIIDKKGAKK